MKCLVLVQIVSMIVEILHPLCSILKQHLLFQLLVNRTLYEKTLASGFGSVHFLLDASEQQQVSEIDSF